MPEPTTDEQVQQNYRKMVAAGPQGAQAVQQAMQEISPGNSDWVEAASNLIEAWEAIRPRMMWEDPEFGGTVCFPPAERPLRKVLNTEIENRNTPRE